MLIIGSHVSFNKKEQLIGSVKEALSYNANTFMFYTGAPQNTNRASIDDSITLSALELMKENNIDLNDLTIDTSVDFASMAGTFISGVGDFVTLFEPSATQVEQKGYGYVVGYIGEYGGSVPYTAYNARKSYISENKDTIQKFTNAINKGIKYTLNNDSLVVSKDIISLFPDTKVNDLKEMIDRYKEYDCWLSNPYISEKLFTNLEDFLIDFKLLDDYVPFNDLVNNFYE
mgnify:CR=1 FL=1